MAQLDLDFKNILVIHFGQLGDVVLGLPALAAIRRRFADARITLMTGRSTAEIVRISGAADEQIVVDRVELRDGPKLRSMAETVRIARDVRRRRFDLVIDLHSLNETNILGFLSGARYRLYADRENRSLNWLGRFPVKPPPEDKSRHLTDRYLDVLVPLGVSGVDRRVHLAPRAEDVEMVRERFFAGVGEEQLAGLFPGAGNPSRCWKLENFAALAAELGSEGNIPVVFLGPEEAGMREAVRETFPNGTIIVDGLSIAEFLAAVSKVDVFVTNDTGPLHMAAGVGVPIVLLLDERAPTTYLPIADRLTVVQNGTIDEITVEQAAAAAREMLGK